MLFFPESPTISVLIVFGKDVFIPFARSELYENELRLPNFQVLPNFCDTNLRLRVGFNRT